jgi:AcrR family transcriptional regulator
MRLARNLRPSSLSKLFLTAQDQVDKCALAAIIKHTNWYVFRDSMYSKSATTITHILAAAQTLFLNRNYADVTMTEIAQTAGVTKGALYHHFPSKEALYLAMMHADLLEKKALFQRAVEGEGTCRERLRNLVETFLRLPRQKRELIKLVRRDINIFKNPMRDRLVRAYQAALPERVEVIIRDGIRSKELSPGDPRLLSWLHVALVEVIVSDYAQEVLGSPAAMADYAVSLFFGGAGKHAT